MQRSKMTLHIIAAACENMGIGYKEKLPWHLKKEMAYFKEKTITATPGKQNAVIMGRKTWNSIPKRLRPLDGRFNVVLTSTQKDVEGADCTVDSFEKAMGVLENKINEKTIDKIFVIGGTSVYKVAMNSDYHQIVYLTRIHADFECDAFFPHLDPKKYSLMIEPENVPQGIQEENGIKYTYEVYAKK